MQEAASAGLIDYSYTQNRELSWLRFDHRVLEEAADAAVPLLERLKFWSIFSTNLDEFFMVRVGSLIDMTSITPNAVDNKSGMTPIQQLKEIYAVIPGLLARKRQVFSEITGELSGKGIIDLPYDQLRPDEKKFADNYFKSMVLPVLAPQVIGSRHPAPRLENKALYIAALLRGKGEKYSFGLIPVPHTLPPILMLPSADGRFLRTETLLLKWAATLFGQYRLEEACILSATRNADISFDSDKYEDIEGDFRSHVMKLLKKRATLSIVRLELSCQVSSAFLALLREQVPVQNGQVYVDSTPLNAAYVFKLIAQLPPALAPTLSYAPYQSRWPADLRRDVGMIEQIQKKDRLLFFPFDTVEPFLQLLSEAADRKDVLSIRITIYRLASSSKIARILCRAAENGKDVTVLMELRARFDEENNVNWSKMLEESGCKVIYGMENYKCHSKICLITLCTKGKMRYITQLGTGNYNEKTNTMYTDLSIMTASDAIGLDGTAFFQNMLINNLDGQYRELLVAPNGIKPKLLELMDAEIAKGSNGYICIKANAVTERDIIDKLHLASLAGVEIQLIIRGICCIRPGIEDYTESISVTSIVGRFLEHGRIYCFGRGDGARLYIGSADLMTRNLRRRVEIACPVYDEEIRTQLMWILRTQLQDTAKASLLQPDGSYLRKREATLAALDSQEEFMRTPIHRESAAGSAEEAVRSIGALRRGLKRLFGRGK